MVIVVAVYRPRQVGTLIPAKSEAPAYLFSVQFLRILYWETVLFYCTHIFRKHR
eukprot:SAG11_NODE_24443_length_373_cov_0.824818_1_plen_53_part_01